MRATYQIRGKILSTKSELLDLSSDLRERRYEVNGLSIIIPVYNEAGNLEVLHEELVESLMGISGKHEIIFVDDGSNDGTPQILNGIFQKDPMVRVIRLRKNFGKSSAINVGIRKATNDILVTMDADLQDDPHGMKELLDVLMSGKDMVVGWRRERKDSFTKKLASKISNGLASRLLGPDIHDFNCGFKAFRKEVMEHVDIIGEVHRYIPTLAAMQGFSVGEVEIKHRPRPWGKSKFGFSRLMKGLFDLLFLTFWSKFSTRPFHYFGMIGLQVFALGFILGVIKVADRVINGTPLEVGPILLLSVLFLITGVQLGLFGFLCEVQIRTGLARGSLYGTSIAYELRHTTE